MTKVELSEVVGMSRPTIDRKLEDQSEYVLFIQSFTKWEFDDRVSRILEAQKKERECQ